LNNSVNTNNSFEHGKICAVIPFYNEEKTVGETVAEVLKHVDFVIAVNDGSTDHSVEKINKLENVIVLNHTVNLGKGEALRKGLEKSIKLYTKYTFTIDADLQHDPEYIPSFVETVNNFDVVIGNRLHDLKDMPLQRRASNFLTSFMLSKKLKTKIIDSQCGYRIFRTEILKDILPENSGFEAESEMIVKAAKKNYKISFTNIPVIYGNDNSKMKSLQAIKGFLKILFM
jgi:glycosyltransferase involved in cell wall biosynthesis